MGGERLEQLARDLARSHEVTSRAGVSLHRVLRSNAQHLAASYSRLKSHHFNSPAMTPAAQWLFDNYYVIDEHVRAIRRDLPVNYYRQLPKLANGPDVGYPRVYALVQSLVNHADSRLDLETLQGMTDAYQDVQILSIGELWAVPITLRIILIDQLARQADAIVYRAHLRESANHLADQLPTSSRSVASLASRVLGGFHSPVPAAFAAQLYQRSREHTVAASPMLSWLVSALEIQGTTPDEIVYREHQRQGQVNASVRNIITSLKWITTVDWAVFFEKVSRVDGTLRRHSDFANFDFPTRDLYRHAIEDLARGAGRSELEIAERALDAANSMRTTRLSSTPTLHSVRACEAGYYLIADGRRSFERNMGYRAPWHQWITRGVHRAGLAGYTGAVTGLSLAMGFLGWAAFRNVGIPPQVLLTGTVCLTLMGSETAVTLVNLWITHTLKPRGIAGLALKEGVPESLRTLIAVPALLTRLSDIEELVRTLEIHYLATQDGEFHFALLSDWSDSPTESVADDEGLLHSAALGIANLNRRYGSLSGRDRFLLLHRPRRWNESDRVWMGFERKRGKLHELNRWILGATDTEFLPVDGRSPAPIPNIKYVITLDADTRLPRDAARTLVGKMAHPLNTPVFDKPLHRVTAGYGMLQPRVTPALAGDNASFFQTVFSGPSGIDPYAFAVSDVYQDLFGEGSYIGKGIYDVAIFEAALAHRVGPNQLLSHDLYEGIFVRCGLATDIELVEEHPTKYAVATARQHRWTRGDWQLLPWIVGHGRTVPALGRWKMADNLRRSLTAPAAVLALALGWAAGAPVGWTVGILLFMVFPILLPMAIRTLPQTTDLTRRAYWSATQKDLRLSLSAIIVQLSVCADHAWLMFDAIVRTLIRMGITRRHLLEWTTTAQSQSRSASGIWPYWRRMAGGVCIAVLLLAVGAWVAPHFPWAALPVLALWIAAPLIAYQVSLPSSAPRSAPLTPQNTLRLQAIARQTWRFFETFVTAEHNDLPPDNFQEIPTPVVATRTSPTNIGLYFLSIVAAREFGWIGTLDAITRLEKTLSTLFRLERYRGHFYNWYDTQDRRALDPKYISTVDSGNLAGHLIALEGACRAWQGSSPASQFLIGMKGCLTGIERQSPAMSATASGVSFDALVIRIRSAAEALSSKMLLGSAETPPVSFSTLLELAQQLKARTADSTLTQSITELISMIESHQRDAASITPSIRDRLAEVCRQARTLALEMQFGFLLDPKRELLSIGYRVPEQIQDPSCYDLLASEARLASFLAIAKGDLPVRHWFRLGRLLTPLRRGSALVSWSGSMFEYLMPILVMKEPQGSVLGDTAVAIVNRQIAFGAERRLPWGVSESAFNARDREMTYQYSSFGVPGLGLQQGLGNEAVVAPYATALAAMVAPLEAIANFLTLERLGARGPYGWYDALDFTPTRVPEGERVAPVKTYMAHHQGMILVSLANILCEGCLRHYFHDDPLVQATELVLQERTPPEADRTEVTPDSADSIPELQSLAAAEPRRLFGTQTADPQTHLLSNGHYSVMATAAGSGYSRWRDIAVTRWREDATCDDWGSYIFLRDVVSGRIWSSGYQPTGAAPDDYRVVFHEDRVEWHRTDGSLHTITELLISPEDDSEVRRVAITNTGARFREVEVTSYAEVVLATPASDAAHPVFSKLFVVTQFVPESGALLATRRNRDSADPVWWLGHACVVEGESLGSLQYETDRAQFIGRGRDLRHAVAVNEARPLSNTTGTVLDPIVSLRRRVRIAPGATAQLSFWTVIAPSRAVALSLLDKYRDTGAVDRVKTLAWTQAQVQLRYLSISFEQARLFQQIAGRILYLNRDMRAAQPMLDESRFSQSALWPYGISGDLPLVVVAVHDEADFAVVQDLLRAHEYWRLKQLAVDLIIFNVKPPSYASELQLAIDAAIRASAAQGFGEGDKRGRVFSLRNDLVPEATSDLLLTVARVVFYAHQGSLSDQLNRLMRPEENPLPKPPVVKSIPAARHIAGLELFNGLGGFAKDGREYVTVLEEGQSTPAPWINVIANPQFGCLISTESCGSTWSLNARENQLTPWSNDPTSDTPSEIIYLQDLDSDALWSATPRPIRCPGVTYVTRHGFGYSRFEHSAHGIELELLQLVPLNDTIKISRLRLINRSAVRRRLVVTHFVEWVLGQQRAKSAEHLITWLDPISQALMVRNPWRTELASRTAFVDMGGRQKTFTADRREFIGRHGTLATPTALINHSVLEQRVGGGLDPCGTLQTTVELLPGETTDILVLLGDAASTEAAVELIHRYRSMSPDDVLRQVTDFWDGTLNKVQVKTPDRSLDIMANGWLLYQTLVCRVWARTGFYQSSGAYGFRDQLQDGMALCISHPALVREHLLRAASRQFIAGDVQHWWLPTTGQGVQTRISDDRVWLAFCVAHYLEVTEDWEVLDEQVPFLEGEPLGPTTHELFAAPAPSVLSASLFDHCVRALDSSLGVGPHGLPLFGTGDWNDGMNRVGEAGRGESVWLGWFLYATLMKFASVAERHKASEKVLTWRDKAYRLQQALEREAWDGDWYRRGYFDDGTPLGSVTSEECRIDAIAQSWAVLSKGGEPTRALRAMAAVDAQLVSRGDGLVKLFTPAFDRTKHDPGYIKAYPPGLRENGGQYSHAAMWTTWAFAQLGDGDRAMELLSLLNPINHSSNKTAMHRYQVEPYVVCADVYSADGHVGRGGWTWYTGSAGWMYRTALEAALGIRMCGSRLVVAPCIPRAWERFEATVIYGRSSYRLAFENPRAVGHGIESAHLDGATIPTDPCTVELVDDGASHLVAVVLGMLS